jgi:hypothetical protein
LFISPAGIAKIVVLEQFPETMAPDFAKKYRLNAV